MRPKAALSGAGGAGAVGGRAARRCCERAGRILDAHGLQQNGDIWTRMLRICSEKGGRGAGGAGAAEGRSTAASEQTRVMQSEQLEMIAL